MGSLFVQQIEFYENKNKKNGHFVMCIWYGASLGDSLCDTHNSTLGLFSRTF